MNMLSPFYELLFEFNFKLISESLDRFDVTAIFESDKFLIQQYQDFSFQLLHNNEEIYYIKGCDESSPQNYYISEFNILKTLIREYKFKEILDNG